MKLIYKGVNQNDTDFTPSLHYQLSIISFFNIVISIYKDIHLFIVDVVFVDPPYT